MPVTATSQALLRAPLARLGAGASSAMLGLGAVSAMLLAGALLLGGARPGWWRQAGPGEVRRTLAGQVDNGAWTVVTKVRPMSSAEGPLRSEPWTVALTAEEATAWLNEKLPRWLIAEQHPARLPHGAELQAAFEPGVVRIGLRTGAEGDGRYISLVVRPRIDHDGLWLPAAGATVGRLEVPRAALFGEEGGQGEGALPREVASLLKGRTPAVRDASFRLPDGRRVRLLGFEPRKDRLILTMQTESER